MEGPLRFEAFEVAQRAGLIVESEGVVGRFQFRHPLIRDAVLARLSVLRRVHLHLRVAAAIETVFPVEIETIAGHHLAGAVPGRPTLAGEWSLRASQVASADSRFRDALDHAWRGLEVVNPTVSPALCCARAARGAR